ncbi:MAG: MOSC domain-containing protein [Gammaproteobacteria bacterium]|jgi:hypothetical protein|nr:MOSC domain-containing protein [Gammaproteobacteria bacterium]
MKTVTVKELYVYPVKGCNGSPVQALDITEQGIVGDREFTFVGDGGVLIEQKQFPKIASVQVEQTSEGLIFKHETEGSILHKARTEGESISAKWVLDEFEGTDQGDEVSQWISHILDMPIRLIRINQPWTVNFPVPDMARLHGKSKRRFTAASELSLTNLASLEALNADLDVPIPMNRFRSNIVVDGIGAYEEDDMDFVVGANVEILQVTPAERCAIISTDQKTGDRPENNIFDVLRKTRVKTEGKFGSGLIFGNYMTVKKPGKLRLGDQLTFEPVARDAVSNGSG